MFFGPVIIPMPMPFHHYDHGSAQQWAPSKKDLCEKDLIIKNPDGTKTITKCRLKFPSSKKYPTGVFITADPICTCETETK